ncbi:glycerol-3-phosphate dehydrogenase subunit GlpB [Desulfosporosinus burensis]
MMTKNVDVLIIGSGLSGLMAAAKAAEKDKKILLVNKGMGALGLSSGCIDLWGYSVDDPSQVCRHPLNEVAKLKGINPEHPYNKVQDVIAESLSFFRQICEQGNNPYVSNQGENWLLPTALGTVRPTYLAPTSMAVDSLSKLDRILVVGFKELKDFYPEVLVTNLKRCGELNEDCQLKTALISMEGDELNPNTLAHRLEQPETMKRVISQLKPLIEPGVTVLFPPVLGERRDSNLAAELAKNLGCPVYEVANIPPAMPGQRLQETLLHYVKARGVEIINGCTVTGADVFGKRCLGVTAAGSHRDFKLSAQTYVLATGSFFGGGLEAKSDRVQEGIFNLPVKTVDGKWSNREFLNIEGHAFNRFGIDVNMFLQPVDNFGQVLIENLLIAGSILAGANYPIEKCGNGVAVASGYKAGELAGRAG